LRQILIALVLVPGLARADDAVLRDGRHLTGTVSVEAGRWRFLPGGTEKPLDIDAPRSVRLETALSPVLHASLPVRVRLRDGQTLTGGFLDLDGKRLSLRTAWATNLSVPRTSLADLTQPTGLALVHAEDFSSSPAGWKIKGKPTLADGTATLTGAGQSVSLALKPLNEGQAAISFQEIGQPAGAQWHVEAEFQTQKGPRRVTVTPGPTIRANVPDLDGESAPIPRTDGWHRVRLKFTPTSLRVQIDDLVAWHSLRHGPGGPLVGWRVACEAGDGAARGKVAFDEFCVHRAIDEPRRPKGDGRQDEFWLEGGDQLFGRLLAAERDGVYLDGPFGRKILPWSRTHGLFLKAGDADPKAPRRDRARLWIDNGFDSRDDVLEGTVLSLDAKQCRLRHAELGEVTFERGRIRRISWPGLVKN
jgi:hypothetical protein